MAASAKRTNEHPRLLTAAKLVRELLPGDSKFGDPLSTGGREQPQLVGRRLAELTAEKPGVLREAGLTALQVWQAMAEAQGRGRGERDLVIVFTDLVGFSDWALQAGDEHALQLLRDVGLAMEPPVSAHGGEVVKRLGDGMMAVFDDAPAALDALREACARVSEIDVNGYSPCFRAGMHVGRPRRIGGDYLGVDVNVAARVAEEADGNEVLVSDRALELLDAGKLDVRRKRRFKVKGVPSDLTAHRVALAR
ncbi:MAG: adenylate/guanylate cyclase domain-containing protein [Actinobacteria bacterium]|nr:adenylate/guanylate cyclase domain-containing protein [Actinomycetota bacterium]